MHSVVAEGLSLALVLLIQRSANVYILGQLVAQAAAVAVALAVARPLLVRRRDLAMVGDALGFALPLVPALLAAFVLQASDRLVLQHDLGSASVARYAVASNIGSIAIIALTALNTVWMPRVFALADARVRDSVLAQSRDSLYALLIPIVMGLGIGAPVLLHIWAPPSYAPNSLRGVVAIIAITSFAVAGEMSHTRTLLAAGRTLAVAVATGVAAALNLVLNLALVPSLRVTGSALATLISYMVLHAMLAAAAGNVTRLRMPRPALLIGIGIAVATAVGAARLPVTFTFLAVRGVMGLVCLIVFGAMVLALAGAAAWSPARWIGRPLISRLVLVTH
jgi:O-antigen/teichoic acid export membrane protein